MLDESKSPECKNARMKFNILNDGILKMGKGGDYWFEKKMGEIIYLLKNTKMYLKDIIRI